MDQITQTAAEPYVVLIGGPGGVGSRITGSIARELSRRELARIRLTISTGGSLEVVTPSRAAWLAMRGNLMRQLRGIL